VRPGDFLRHRAGLSLAAHGDPAADLRGAFLFGQEEAALHVLLGDFQLARGEQRASARSYRAALTRAPELADAWNGLGQALHAGGDLPGALEALREAARAAPRDAWVRNNLGVVLRDLGRLQEAATQFDVAVELEPDLFIACFNRGDVADRLGWSEDARAWFARARALRQGAPEGVQP
jgi:tetratricopeptide (TPR) repeat protein